MCGICAEMLSLTIFGSRATFVNLYVSMTLMSSTHTRKSAPSTLHSSNASMLHGFMASVALE